MRAMRDLNLTDAQKSQIKSIMQSARSADAGNAAATDPQTRRQNMMTTRRQIEGVLTDTQRTQLQANLTKMRHDKNAAGPGGQTAPAQPR